MGAWGFGIRQDDFVSDVEDSFENLLKRGATIAQATDQVRKEYADAAKDPDDGPLFWIAIADVQWKYGELSPDVLKRVKSDFENDAGMAGWGDKSERRFQKRKKALSEFVAKLGSPNPKPRRRPKLVVRKPLFAEGDCLSVKLNNGLYGAAFVLASNHSQPEYGMNLVGTLDVMSEEKPTAETFENRKYLKRFVGSEEWVDIAWYLTVRFRPVRQRIEIVGRTARKADEPRESDRFAFWEMLVNDKLRTGKGSSISL
jgi:hypothetical protein